MGYSGATYLNDGKIKVIIFLGLGSYQPEEAAREMFGELSESADLDVGTARACIC